MNRKIFGYLTIALSIVLGLSLVIRNPVIASPPDNDEFSTPTDISGLPYDSPVDTIEATTNSATDISSCGYEPAYTVWYRFTPLETTPVQFTISEGTFDALLTIYRDDFYNEQYCTVIYQSDYAQFNFILDGGVTYYIRISSFISSPYADPSPIATGGMLRLIIDQLPGPPNDNFANAIVIDAVPFNDGQDITYATLESGEPSPSCASWASPGKTVWYSFTPGSNGMFEGYTSSWFPNFLAVYASDTSGGLGEVACQYYGGGFTISLLAGETYYIQAGSLYGYTGWLSTYLNFIPAPPNDNFADAITLTSLPFSIEINNRTATLEVGEPLPNCSWSANRTVWFAFTPIQSGSVTTRLTDGFSTFVAVYTESFPGNLTQIDCGAWGNIVTIHYEAGTTYYFQVGSIGDEGGGLSFDLYETPPPNASFYFWPGDPSSFDDIYFSNNSWDPYNEGISSVLWDFGDGSTGTEYSLNHRFASDGDYTVRLQIWTYDGRYAETTSLVQVRTHDVAITKFTVPQSASVNQSRTITVSVRNLRYSEYVTVELQKSSPSGWQWVGTLYQYVPIRPSNRTTNFVFKYTFTKEDASMNKVTFRAIAVIQNYRDALPGDNEVIALPTSVR